MPEVQNYPRVSRYKTPEAFRERLHELGLDLPLDDAIQTAQQGSPMAQGATVFGKPVGNRWCIHPMEGWDGTEDGLYDTPYRYAFECTYETGVTIQISSTLRGGTRWIGEDGWVWVNRGGLEASDQRLLQADAIGPNDIRLYRSSDHFQNFLDCVKSRQETVCPAETGCRSISVGHLGEIAMLLGRKIRWNPTTEEIINDPEASSLLGRAYRAPWTLA